jgi:putative protease
MELLAPAGDRESMIAAVQNGADAVYLGTRGFNARRNADNFEGEGLSEAVRYCHARGVRVYVTLNTMAREDEMEALEKAITEIYLSGADAVIVQDLGVAEAVRRVAPQMELHASTQMAVHNSQGVDFLAKRGFKRAVLAREMAFSEIADCAGRGVQLEAFAHGALCVSCSGQCLFSSMIGGRSGNRGMCAQPCRMLYKLGDREGYLLSTRDLMTVNMLDKYRDAGVSSLKIEGRMRRPEYVAVVTNVYRHALDGREITKRDIEALKQIFNRGGFTQGYAPGIEERTLMYHARPNNAGVRVGRSDKRGEVTLEADVERGDALVLRDDVPVKLSGQAGSTLLCPEAKKGDVLVRLVSERQMRGARNSYAKENRFFRLGAHLVLEVGKPAMLTVGDGRNVVEAEGAAVEKAQKSPTDASRLAEQVRKTGGTPYVIDNVEIQSDPDAFFPLSEVNALRRDALEKLTDLRCAFSRTAGKIGAVSVPRVRFARPELRAQSGDVDALLLAIASGADAAVYAPEDMRDLDAALKLRRLWLAVPEVMRAEELTQINEWAARNAGRIAGVYLSNVSHLDLSWPGERVADYPLNIASDLAVSAVDADAYAPSVELTARQIEALGGKKDIVVYGRLPLMQLRHCPYRAAERLPGLHRDCRVCDRDGAGRLPDLIDRTGARFPLRRLAYASGCVVQVLNSVPIMLLRHIDRLPEAAIWRIFVEKGDAAMAARLYRAARDGRDYKVLPEWEKMDAMKSTTGHYFRGVE